MTPTASQDFRKVLGQFATGITVATTKDSKGQPVGVTINSFTSVSLDPPLVLFCLGRTATTFPIFNQAQTFAFNILAQNQQDLSQRFAKSTLASWQGLEYENGPSGSPLLKGCLGFIECQRYATYNGGDHVIFVGRVLHLQTAENGQPLLYFRGQYKELPV